MESNVTHSILTILLEIASITGSILGVGHWIGKRFDRVYDKFDSFCKEMKDIQLNARTHVTFEHCHDKREACPCVSTIKEIQQNLKKSTTRSRRNPQNGKN